MKKLNWPGFGVAALMLWIVLLLMVFLALHPQSPLAPLVKMDLPRIILGYLLLTWGIFGLIVFLSPRDWSTRKTTGGGGVFAGWAFLALLVCFFGGYFMATLPAFQLFKEGGEGFWSKFFFAFREENGVVLLLLLAFAYHLTWLLTVEKRHQIREGYVVSLEGKTLYPGDEVNLYPWFSYRPQILPENLSLSSEERVRLAGKEYRLYALTEIRVGIKEAQARRVSLGDSENLIRNCQAWVSRAFFAQLSALSFKDLAEGTPTLPPQSTDIAGFPIRWDGNVRIELEEAKGRQ